MINCPKNKKLEDCELEILRNAVDNIEKKAGQKMINNPEINTIISIVEDFIRENSLGKEIYTICQKGIRSEKASQILIKESIKSISIEGGIDNSVEIEDLVFTKYKVDEEE